MGHPPGAVWVPAPGYADLADEVERVGAWHGAPPSVLAAALRGEGAAEPAQLAAIAWVLDPPGRHVLLVEHRTFGWSCPGGHVERGEHPADAAARELTEETGIIAGPNRHGPVSISYAGAPADANGPAHHHWLVGYRFVADPSTPTRTERDAVAWHPVDTLPDGCADDLAPLLDAIRAEHL